MPFECQKIAKNCLFFSTKLPLAGCERGLSVIKSQRTSLAIPTLSDLMCGLLESFDIDKYDPSKVCGLWAEEVFRKSLYSRVKTANNF